MSGDWLKRWFGGRRKEEDEKEETARPDLPPVAWLGPAENRWGVPVLDIRPVTLGMLSMTQNSECARNVAAFAGDDGTGFIGAVPSVERRIEAGLRFRVEGTLADGVLFAPREMEHKWGLYAHQGRILFIDSWLRQLRVTADVRASGDHLEVTAVQGVFTRADEAPELTVRTLEFLLRSHALDEVYPAPIPPGLEQDPEKAAIWCFSIFGNRAYLATPHPLATAPPERPLRTDSLLHIAVAREDPARMAALLDAGVPAGVRSRDGMAPLHWAVGVQDGARLAALLLERGSPVDVRSDEGATPLMNAVQDGSLAMAAFLLDHGADPGAADERGFTALHRAAEMGRPELVRLLLDRGAAPGVEAQGHTPRSLATARGHGDIVEMLDGR